MQSKKFVDGTVSPKLNFRALAEKVIEKNKSVIKKLGKNKNKVKPVEAVAVKGKLTAFKSKGKLKSTAVSNKASAEDKEGRRNVLNNLISTAGTTLTGIFKKPDTYVTNNTTMAAPSGNEDNKEKDNTMLYAGIGGAVLLVVILLVMLKK